MAKKTTTPDPIFFDSKNYSQFDENRIVIDDAVTNEYKIGKDMVQTCTSSGWYLNENDEKCVLFIGAPKQNVFGVTWNYKFGTDPKADPSAEDKIEGAQVCYPLTSLKTVVEPTDDEKGFKNIVDCLQKAVLAKAKEEAELDEDDTRVPPAVRGSYNNVKTAKKQDWNRFVKQLYDYPSDSKDKTKKDTTKPQRMYIKLYTTGKGKDCKIMTPFYGPGNKKENPARFIEARGEITPVFRWEGSFYGPHGPKAPYAVSTRLKMTEANFTPGASSGPSYRFLSANDAIDDENEEIKKRPVGESEGFTQPGGASGVNKLREKLAAAPKPKAPAGTTAGTTAVPKAGAKPLAKPKAPTSTKVSVKSVVTTAKPISKPVPKVASKVEDEEIEDEENE